MAKNGIVKETREEKKELAPSESPKIKPTFPTFIKSTLKNLKKLNIKTNQVMVALLIMAAFLIGVLYTKVQYLEKGQNTAAVPSQQGQQAGTQPNQPAPGQKVDVKVGDLPVMGDKNAKVTVIEFADFQCPFCEKWFTESEANLIKDYVDSGKVKFAFRNYAFLGEESTWSAEAAYCANDQGKFWEFHDYLYQHQGAENSGAFSKKNLKSFAATLGLNTSSFNSCLDSDKYAQKVADDKKAGDAAGTTGTPTTYINGTPIVGAQPYSVFQQAIDQELKK